MSIKDDELREFFGDDGNKDAKDWSDTLEIPTLDGIERQMLGEDADHTEIDGSESDIFFPGFPEEEDSADLEGYSFDPRDEDESSDSVYDYSEENEEESLIFSELAPPMAAQRQKKRYTFSFGFVVGMTVVIVVAALGVAIAMYAGYDFGFGVMPPTTAEATQGETEQSPPVTDEKKQTEAQTEAKTEVQTEAQTEPITDRLAVKSELVSEGALVLVNKTHEYTFPDIVLESLYEVKNDSYKISSSTIELEQTAAGALNEMAAAFEAESGKHDLLVASGVRSYDEQLELYSARVEKYGLENAKKYVAEPGHSEHHTGLSFDLSVYTDEGVGMLLSDSPEYDWVTEHCHEYGFIRRYEDDKADITGISEEDWHFRYVGRAHAYYMSANDLCLEEYIELVKKYSYENRLGFNETSGKRYEIYFVPVSSGEETVIPLPQDGNITTDVSGTNSGGFIVTVSYS